MLIQYPNMPGIVLGLGIGVTAIISGIPLLFMRSQNKPTRINIALGALGLGAALTLVPVIMGAQSGHSLLESAFSGTRGNSIQVAALIFGVALLVVEAIVCLTHSFRKDRNGT